LPTYDYQCRNCGHTIEVIHPMTEDGPSTCEVCGGPLRRILHPAGIIFKGSGFYKTDSRSSSTASVPASSSKAAAPASDGDGGASAPAADKSKTENAKPASGGGASTTKTGD
jgi:putative FmdB family regulatory protein